MIFFSYRRKLNVLTTSHADLKIRIDVKSKDDGKKSRVKKTHCNNIENPNLHIQRQWIEVKEHSSSIQMMRDDDTDEYCHYDHHNSRFCSCYKWNTQTLLIKLFTYIMKVLLKVTGFSKFLALVHKINGILDRNWIKSVTNTVRLRRPGKLTVWLSCISHQEAWTAILASLIYNQLLDKT